MGDRRLQALTRADIDALASWMLTSGRVRAGTPGTGLSARTVKDTLAVLQRALDDAADERLVSHNPCRRVKRPRQDKPEHALWSDEEMARFELAAAADRLAPVIRCNASGCAQRKCAACAGAATST